MAMRMSGRSSYNPFTFPIFLLLLVWHLLVVCSHCLFRHSQFIGPAWDSPFPMDITHNDQYPQHQLHNSREKPAEDVSEQDFGWTFPEIVREWIFRIL